MVAVAIGYFNARRQFVLSRLPQHTRMPAIISSHRRCRRSSPSLVVGCSSPNIVTHHHWDHSSMPPQSPSDTLPLFILGQSTPPYLPICLTAPDEPIAWDIYGFAWRAFAVVRHHIIVCVASFDAMPVMNGCLRLITITTCLPMFAYPRRHAYRFRQAPFGLPEFIDYRRSFLSPAGASFVIIFHAALLVRVFSDATASFLIRPSLCRYVFLILILIIRL